MLGLDFLKTFELDCISVKFGFLFVKVVIQVHHFLFSVLGLAFTFVSLSEGSQFLFLNFYSELVHTFVEWVHDLIQWDDLRNEFHWQWLKLIWFTIFLCFKDTNVVVLVKGNWRSCRHFIKRKFKYFFEYLTFINLICFAF